MTDNYKNHKHTAKEILMPVQTYYIDGIQVCLSWYGCDKHPREACKFLLARHFGCILVCGLTGDDLIIDEGICQVPDNCPLKEEEND